MENWENASFWYIIAAVSQAYIFSCPSIIIRMSVRIKCIIKSINIRQKGERRLCYYCGDLDSFLGGNKSNVKLCNFLSLFPVCFRLSVLEIPTHKIIW